MPSVVFLIICGYVEKITSHFFSVVLYHFFHTDIYISGKSILLVRGDFLKKQIIFTHFLYVDQQIHTGSASQLVWKNVFFICWISPGKLEIGNVPQKLYWTIFDVFGLKLAQLLNVFEPMTKKCPRSCQETHWFGLGVMAHKNVKNSFFVPIGFTRDIHDTTAKRGWGRNQISAVWETMIQFTSKTPQNPPNECPSPQECCTPSHPLLVILFFPVNFEPQK